MRSMSNELRWTLRCLDYAKVFIGAKIEQCGSIHIFWNMMKLQTAHDVLIHGSPHKCHGTLHLGVSSLENR